MLQQPKKNTCNRRDIMKKAGIASLFIAPTIVSFKTADLAVAASGNGQTKEIKPQNDGKGFKPQKQQKPKKQLKPKKH
jgi:hypothetical protein